MNIVPDNNQRNGAGNEHARNKRKNTAEISIPILNVTHQNTGEDMVYLNGIANFTKGLRHNNDGTVSETDFQQFLEAIQLSLNDLPNYKNCVSYFEDVPTAQDAFGDNRRKWVNPVAGLSYDSEGLDSFTKGNQFVPPHPKLDSLNAAAEIAEVYWMSLMRDINFTDYDEPEVSELTEQAVSELNDKFSDYKFIVNGHETTWTRDNQPITVKTLFRGVNIGDNVGPYISQFLYRGNVDEPLKRDEKDGYVKYGATSIDQRIVVAKKGLDFMTDNNSWLEVQDGLPVFNNGDRLTEKGKDYFDDERRFIRNLRDLATFVHFDQLYQSYLTACFYMLEAGFKFSSTIPYQNDSITKQQGFSNFDGPHIISLIPEVATRALKAIWLQKWFVHRRLRPEAFGGLIHFKKTGEATTDYTIHPSILESNVLMKVKAKQDTYFLSQAFKEGSPMHPSYGAGHATVAGACVTMLKAWFEDEPMPGTILESKHDGKGLKEYEGNDADQITIHGELNKLAANIAIGRNGAGVHYRSDYTSSMVLGEEVAISILKELRDYLPEPPTNTSQPIFRFRRFFTADNDPPLEI